MSSSFLGSQSNAPKTHISRASKERAGPVSLAHLLHCILVLKYCFVTIQKCNQSILTTKQPIYQTKPEMLWTRAALQIYPREVARQLNFREGVNSLSTALMANFMPAKTSVHTKGHRWPRARFATMSLSVSGMAGSLTFVPESALPSGRRFRRMKLWFGMEW